MNKKLMAILLMGTMSGSVFASAEGDTNSRDSFVSALLVAYEASDVEQLKQLKEEYQQQYPDLSALGNEYLRLNFGNTEAPSDRAGNYGWDKMIDYAESSAKWDSFTSEMREAYELGDIEALERLKVKGEGLGGFGNLNDLGEPFFKYGSGLEQWDEMIEDAKLNARR